MDGHRARLLGIAFGLIGFSVVALSLTETVQTASLTSLSTRLILREPFRPEVLTDFQEKADRFEQSQGCSITALSGVALLRAVTAEAALVGGASETDNQLAKLQAAASSLLKCSPTQGFGWFALYWTELNRSGPSPRALSYLAMSYDTAPREAWIALMRNEAATRVLTLVSPQIKAAILDEWRDLLRAGLHGDAARILAQANSARRDVLIAAIADLDPAVLKWLPAHLNRLGLDIEIPNMPEGASQERSRYRPFR